MPQGHVYILASKRNGTIYTGVTNNLAARIFAHREGRGSVFTKRYNVKILVWYESYDMVVDAIQRETSIKRWPRKWKLALIEKTIQTGMIFTRLLGEVWVAGSSPAMEGIGLSVSGLRNLSNG